MTDLLHSPVHDRHVALGAKMADFGGWEMPIEYPGGGVVAEHTAVRERVGLFDVSHLGKARVSGRAGASAPSTSSTPASPTTCAGSVPARPSTRCAARTTAASSTTSSPTSAATRTSSSSPTPPTPPRSSSCSAPPRPRASTVENLHDAYAVFAVQGPLSDEVLTALGLPVGHDYMSFVEAQWQGSPVIVCRTGYTGERGYELVPAWDAAGALWDALAAAVADHGGMPAGLGARDTLRTEMGYPLHGNDLSTEITPVMAGAAWAVGWDKEAFWGKEALAEQRAAKTSRLTRGLVVTGRGIPRAHCPVLKDGEVVGEVTSGTFSPTRKEGIALAQLDRSVTVGDEVVIDVRGREVPATVTKPPFVEVGVREA